MKCTRRVREFAARLINALASDYSGRSYLLESDKMVFQLIQILQSEVNLILFKGRITLNVLEWRHNFTKKLLGSATKALVEKKTADYYDRTRPHKMDCTNLEEREGYIRRIQLRICYCVVHESLASIAGEEKMRRSKD